MPTWLRRLLLRMPEAHHGWTCRWYLAIVLTASAAGVVGLVAGGILNAVLASAAFLLVGVVTGMRRSNPHC
jgi:hypothetical protein